MVRNSRIWYVLGLTFIILSVSTSAVSQGARFHIDYTVAVIDTDSRLFHVTANVQNIREPNLDLSLPAWTPGWYTVENYAKNILRFRVTDAKGAALPHTMTRKQTWRVETKGLDQIKVEFDYLADVLALNQAKITKDFAFFTGTELFLQAQGHRDSPSTVRFSLPSGWKVVSALKETDDPLIFSAPDYDVLVDAPTEMGHFDVTRFEVAGKAHYFVANPAGSFSTEKSRKFTEMLAKVANAESAIFGGLPYEKYVYFYFFAPAESNASGALEHLNSHVSFGAPGNFAEPEQLIGTAAHEYFHLWNVKRIRPVEMWPYDYTHENETPLLWVSEGFTSYYGALSTYRAGLSSSQDFLQHLADAAAGVENNEVRAYVSPAEASVSTWLGYDSPVVFGISYYTQGMNIAGLMDLSIRHDTNGRSGLDDLMRALYEECYKRGKGFSADDMIGIINRLTGRDYHDFFRRYVSGVDVPPYETIFGYAGYRVEKTRRQTAWAGFDARNRRGTLVVGSITPNSPAAKAGIETGDSILKVNGALPFTVNPDELAGKTAKLTISRDGEEKEISVNVIARTETRYRLTETPQPTPEQLKVRQAWLKP